MRLNKTHKSTIVNSVMDKKYPGKIKDEMLDKLKLQAYDFITKDIPDGWEQFDKYIRKTSTIFINYIDDKNYNRFIQLNCKAIPCSNGHCYDLSCISLVNGKRVLPKRMQNLFDKYRMFIKDKREFKTELVSTLDAITTDKQLRDNLPKLVKYLPQDKQCGLIPVATFDAMNKKLEGL